MLFKSPVLSQASGSLAGSTYARNRGGMYIRARAIPTDPASPLQTAMRAVLGDLSRAWSQVLTDAQRESWNAYAGAITVINPLGDPITLSGQNQFIRLNTVRDQIGVAVQLTAPTDLTLPMVGALNAVLDASDQQAVITFDDSQPWVNEDGGHLVLFIGRPQSAGVSFFRGPYRFMGTIDGAALVPPTSPADVDPLPFVLVAGQKVWLSANAITETGGLSQPIDFGPFIVQE